MAIVNQFVVVDCGGGLTTPVFDSDTQRERFMRISRDCVVVCPRSLEHEMSTRMTFYTKDVVYCSDAQPTDNILEHVGAEYGDDVSILFLGAEEQFHSMPSPTKIYYMRKRRHDVDDSIKIDSPENWRERYVTTTRDISFDQGSSFDFFELLRIDAFSKKVGRI